MSGQLGITTQASYLIQTDASESIQANTRWAPAQMPIGERDMVGINPLCAQGPGAGRGLRKSPIKPVPAALPPNCMATGIGQPPA